MAHPTQTETHDGLANWSRKASRGPAAGFRRPVVAGPEDRPRPGRLGPGGPAARAYLPTRRSRPRVAVAISLEHRTPWSAWRGPVGSAGCRIIVCREKLHAGPGQAREGRVGDNRLQPGRRRAMPLHTVAPAVAGQRAVSSASELSHSYRGELLTTALENRSDGYRHGHSSK